MRPRRRVLLFPAVKRGGGGGGEAEGRGDRRPAMEIGRYPVSGCSKEHQKIYQEWFALADSGPIHPLLCSPPIPNPPLSLLLAWVAAWSNLIDGAADGDGRITGPDAIKFFGMSKLSRPDLKQVRPLAVAPPAFLFCLAGGAIGFSFPHVPFFVELCCD